MDYVYDPTKPLDPNEQGWIEQTPFKQLQANKIYTKFLYALQEQNTDTTTSLTPNAENTDFYVLTGLTASITINNPEGTIYNGKALVFRLKDDGTARGITWGAKYRSGTDVTLPSTTTISKHLYIGFLYNKEDDKLDCVAKVDGY